MNHMPFSTPMVQAIQENRKTQTRRKPRKQPVPWGGCDHSKGFYDIGGNNWVCRGCGYGVMENGKSFIASRHRPGDILWVKEAWGTYTKDWKDSDRFLYRADYPDGAKGYWHEPEQINWCDLPRWRSPRFMPKEVARLFLLVKSVWPERLQDITEEDAIAEGVDLNFEASDPNVCKWQNYRDAYRAFWDKLNAKRGFPFKSNPWVWKYVFERTEKP